MNSFLQTLDKVASKLLEPLKRFPFASISAFIFILLMIIDISNRGGLESRDMLNKITFVSALAFLFFISLRLMRKGWILSIIGVLIVLSYYFYLPASLTEYMAKAEGQIIAPLMFLALFLLIIVSPFLSHKSSNIVFFEWIKHLIYNLLLSAGLGFIFFIVLNVGLEIIKKLFELNINYWYNSIIGFFSFAFIAVFFFLSQIPKEPTKLMVKEYNKIENFFVRYVLTSLFIIYFLIIYIYTGKMIILAEYPKGVISWNIIAFSILAILTYLFWTPLWNEKNQKYKKVIWIAIILQTFLLAVALYLRVEPYGWTLGRIILASLGLWLFVLSLYALVKKTISYQIMFISIALLIILNLLFASSISKASQQDRLGVLLSKNSILSNDSNLSLRYNISSKIDYLYNYYGTDALLPLIPRIVTEYEEIKSLPKSDCSVQTVSFFPKYATDKLGFKYVSKWEWKRNKQKNQIEKGRLRHYNVNFSYTYGLDIQGYDKLIEFNYYKDNKHYPTLSLCPTTPYESLVKKRDIGFNAKSNELIIKYKQKDVGKINLNKFISKILKKEIDSKSMNISPYYRNDFTQDEFSYLYENNTIKVKLIFNSFIFSMKDEVFSYGGILLFAKK